MRPSHFLQINMEIVLEEEEEGEEEKENSETDVLLSLL